MNIGADDTDIESPEVDVRDLISTGEENLDNKSVPDSVGAEIEAKVLASDMSSDSAGTSNAIGVDMSENITGACGHIHISDRSEVVGQETDPIEEDESDTGFDYDPGTFDDSDVIFMSEYRVEFEGDESSDKLASENEIKQEDE